MFSFLSNTTVKIFLIVIVLVIIIGGGFLFKTTIENWIGERANQAEVAWSKSAADAQIKILNEQNSMHRAKIIIMRGQQASGNHGCSNPQSELVSSCSVCEHVVQ